jgi:phosphoglucosamine mutase
MQERGWRLGGESSGHIICADLTTTGDGIVAALQVLVALRAADTDMATLKSGMTKYPQHMINVQVAGQVNLDDNADLQAAVADTESELGDRGRVLLRASGTEPVVRVMLEGEDAGEVETLCGQLAQRVSGLLGS